MATSSRMFSASAALLTSLIISLTTAVPTSTACNRDNCLRAVFASSHSPGPSAGSTDCQSFMTTTVVTPASTATQTTTVTTIDGTVTGTYYTGTTYTTETEGTETITITTTSTYYTTEITTTTTTTTETIPQYITQVIPASVPSTTIATSLVIPTPSEITIPALPTDSLSATTITGGDGGPTSLPDEPITLPFTGTIPDAPETTTLEPVSSTPDGGDEPTSVPFFTGTIPSGPDPTTTILGNGCAVVIPGVATFTVPPFPTLLGIAVTICPSITIDLPPAILTAIPFAESPTTSTYVAAPVSTRKVTLPIFSIPLKGREASPAAASTPAPSMSSGTIPAYASACSGSVRYSSACSCNGITAGTTTASAGTTTVTSTFMEHDTSTVIVTTDETVTQTSPAFTSVFVTETATSTIDGGTYTTTVTSTYELPVTVTVLG